MRQFKNFGNVNLAKCITAAVQTGDVNGASIDRKDWDSVNFIFSVGASGDTLDGSNYIELELEHSDDNSAWSDCADADLSAAVTGTNTGTAAKIDDAAEDDTVVSVAYMGRKRYVRPVNNMTGTHSNGTPISCVAVQERGKYTS